MTEGDTIVIRITRKRIHSLIKDAIYAANASIPEREIADRVFEALKKNETLEIPKAERESAGPTSWMSR